MKKILIIVLILVLLLMLTATACLDGGLFSDFGYREKVVLNGKVRDVYFNPIAGVEIFFGEWDVSLRTVSDSDGEFTLEFDMAQYDYDLSRIKDFISLDSNLYKYQAVNPSTNTYYDNTVEIVCAPVDSDIDVFNLLDYSNKITFHEDGIPLPDDYYNLGSYGGFTRNGETRLIGVKFYIDGNLVGVMHREGFEIHNIYPGSIITLEKEGFSFVELARGGAKNLVAYDSEGNEYPDSFNAPYFAQPFPLNIRAVLKEGVSIEDLDL